jgi:hypothetical protein
MKGTIYWVIYADEILIAACRNPEFDACRVLLARDITGHLEMWRSGKTWWDLAVDIEVGAGLTLRETETEGPRIVRWVPFPAARGPAFLADRMRWLESRSLRANSQAVH